MQVETKVGVATIGAAVATLVIGFAARGGLSLSSDEMIAATTIIVAVVTFASGWLAPHTTR